MLVVYRGKHCPLCKRDFKTLNEMLGELRQASVTVVAVSADSKDEAAADVANEGWEFSVGYGSTQEQMCLAANARDKANTRKIKNIIGMIVTPAHRVRL